MNKAVDKINRVTAEAEVGKVYKGTVRKVVDFGAFVEILPGTDGLVHISQLGGGGRIRKVTDVVEEGDEIMADVTRRLHLRHLRGAPTSWVSCTAAGKTKRAGTGLSFWYRPLTAVLSEVPVDDRELPLLFHARTVDFADVTVQATVTFRVGDISEGRAPNVILLPRDVLYVEERIF